MVELPLADRLLIAEVHLLPKVNISRIHKKLPSERVDMYNLRKSFLGRMKAMCRRFAMTILVD